MISILAVSLRIPYCFHHFVVLHPVEHPGVQNLFLFPPTLFGLTVDVFALEAKLINDFMAAGTLSHGDIVFELI